MSSCSGNLISDLFSAASCTTIMEPGHICHWRRMRRIPALFSRESRDPWSRYPRSAVFIIGTKDAPPSCALRFCCRCHPMSLAHFVFQDFIKRHCTPLPPENGKFEDAVRCPERASGVNLPQHSSLRTDRTRFWRSTGSLTRIYLQGRAGRTGSN